MTKNRRHEPLLRGPFTTAAVAAGAELPASTVRSYADPERGFVSARTMWPKIYGDEGRDQERRRKAAEKLKAQLEADGEDAAWIAETLKRLEQPKGPREFADVELLQICALAELTRHGFAPGSTRGAAEEEPPRRRNASAGDTYLLDALTRELAVRAFLVPAVGDREPLGPHTRDDEGGAAERYLVAESRGNLAIQVLTPRELQRYFSDPERRGNAVWTVIDCDGLLQRIIARLREAEREEPK